jgi:hypothetical protein
VFRAARKAAIGGLITLISLFCIAGQPGTARASGPGYYYAGGYQTLAAGNTVRGVSANVWVANPYRQANSGEHTLMEIAAKNTTNNDVVEWGWDSDGSGGGGPRLFFSYWAAGVWSGCYFTCTGWNDNGSNPINLGAGLSSVASATFPGNVKAFSFQYVASACGAAAAGVFFYYDGVNVGCLQGSLIPSTSTFDETHAYGEVYYGGATVPCTDMGDGKSSGALGAAGPAYFGSVGYIGQAPTAFSPSLTLSSTVAAAYTTVNVGSTGNRTFGLGGAGYTSTGSTPGNIGSC